MPLLADAGSEGEQRQADRPGNRHQVPLLYRLPPEQGDLALPSVPTGLRPLRHRIQRLYPFPRRSRTPRDDPPDRLPRTLGIAPDLHDLRDGRHPAQGLQRPGLDASIPPTAPPRGILQRPNRKLHPLGEPPRQIETNRVPHRIHPPHESVAAFRHRGGRPRGRVPAKARPSAGRRGSTVMRSRCTTHPFARTTGT